MNQSTLVQYAISKKGSIEALAVFLDVCVSTLQKWKSGKVTMPANHYATLLNMFRENTPRICVFDESEYYTLAVLFEYLKRKDYAKVEEMLKDFELPVYIRESNKSIL